MYACRVCVCVVIVIISALQSSLVFQTTSPVFAFCIMQTLGKLHFGSRYQVLLLVVLKLASSVQVVL